MQNIESAIALLNAVRSTMDSISVAGIENQDKFVGCANAIQTVSKTLEKHLQEIKATESAKEEPDGR